MGSPIIETRYPISFRRTEAEMLSKYLRNRQSVILVGMKRVGISNFLRFFLYHKDILKTYFTSREKHLFILVDLNDLIERELFPFWILTLKRIVDALGRVPLGQKIKKEIERLFLESIQTQDSFLTTENVRRALVAIAETGFFPTLFLLRFDRLKEAFTPEFFANLQGLRDATHSKLAYVFTSFRSLDILSPAVFPRVSLAPFCQEIYIKPARLEDAYSVLEAYKSHFRLAFSPGMMQVLLQIVGGYIQYLQLARISLYEAKTTIKSFSHLFDFLIKEERISLQSAELWESLSPQEQAILLKINKGERLSEEEKKVRYLWETGFIVKKGGKQALFSPLFSHYLTDREKENLGENNGAEFTRKENSLFNFLVQNLNQVCERERIIEAVWPEVKALGVSDWAIDRLVARARNKLEQKNSPFRIQTVKTRGYKLVNTVV